MPYDVLVQTWYAVVADGEGGQEWEGPAVACAEDDVVYICNTGSVDEVHCSVDHFGDGWMLLDLGVVECYVAEEGVCGVADGYTMDG